MSDAIGLRCPSCGCRHFYTVNTIRQEGRIYRRRQCRHCGRIVPSYEYLAGYSGVRRRGEALNRDSASEPE